MVDNQAVKVESANRLLFTKSWEDLEDIRGGKKCLTVNIWTLSGTNIDVSNGADKFFDLFNSTELKTLTAALVTRVDRYSMDESKLGWSGFGVALSHFNVAIKSAFTSETDFDKETGKSNRFEINLILGVKMSDGDLDLDSQTSESNDFDSMDSARFYTDSLRDYFGI